MLLDALDRLRLLHRFKQVHVLVDGLAGLLIGGVSFFEKDVEGLSVFLLFTFEALLQRTLLHLHAAFFFKSDLIGVPPLNEFEFILRRLFKLAGKVCQVPLKLSRSLLPNFVVHILVSHVGIVVLLQEGLGRHLVVFRFQPVAVVGPARLVPHLVVFCVSSG